MNSVVAFFAFVILAANAELVGGGEASATFA